MRRTLWVVYIAALCIFVGIAALSALGWLTDQRPGQELPPGATVECEPDVGQYAGDCYIVP